MLHLWHREWLLRPDASRLWNTHLTRAQPGELPVGAALNWENGSILNIFSDNSHGSCVHLCRFFLMYLINKDETEHTGQVRIDTCLLKALCLVSCVWSSSRRLCRITETSDAFFFLVQHFNPLVVLHKSSRRKKQCVGFFFDIYLSSSTWASSCFIWCSHTLLMSQTLWKEK